MSDKTIFCPWCFNRFDSRDEWEKEFNENHPIVSRMNKILPLNAP